MSDSEDWGFAAPPFDAEGALTSLKRSLRDLKLTERGAAFELRGRPALQLAVEAGAITVRLARRLTLTPEWDRQTVKSGADQRKLIDEVKRRRERWQRED